MKIKVTDKSYEQVPALPQEEHRKPLKPSIFFRTLLKLLSAADLKATNFHCRSIGMERLGADEPCLFLMNHSSFIDLKIASTILYPRPFNIVCTSDGFVGKAWLMRHLGCIPTQKFVSDLSLVRDMLYTVKELRSSILMYPEASYSFDGTATPLPESIGKCVKMLGVPLVMIRTYGAFARDPLYNGLQLRKVEVSADMEYLLSPQEIAGASPAEINSLLAERFSFDNFRDQQERNIRITEPFRADGLKRVLYKCPHCGKEGAMTGKGITLRCGSCGKPYLLTETGFLQAQEGETEFPHIPEWYRWERSCVRQELLDGSYRLDIPVRICMLVDSKSIYRVGEGRLIHTREGFHLSGCEGKLDYRQKPSSSYSLYSDYFWYELGDMICIGNRKVLYYCFPTGQQDVVAKTRLAAEELYKLTKAGQLSG
ncbi:MAG: 1-acyl-sn-glycerol-3-phosphate acyltransferase [Oscillospiraceae bacterium]|nr:1-acyl-sn-glycerol-3-phosphate acyltransferase [Oscillospiraceae bacterium]